MQPHNRADDEYPWTYLLQVYDYLVKTPAGSQTREGLQEFFKGAEEYKLTKAEYLQASNLRPSTAVEVHLVVFQQYPSFP
jgi:hypothetical protein